MQPKDAAIRKAARKVCVQRNYEEETKKMQ